jgi:predicted small metal-binding protein
MAYRLTCAETGAKCPFTVTTESKEELMQHVGIHAKMAHPEQAAKPPSPEMIEKLIHVV